MPVWFGEKCYAVYLTYGRYEYLSFFRIKGAELDFIFDSFEV